MGIDWKHVFIGAGEQGLADINETNAFYNDIAKKASLNLTNATQTLNNEWDENVETGQKKIDNYLAIVDVLGKDKADFIFVQRPDIIESVEFMSMAKRIPFGKDFKWTAKTEPLDVMTKNINKERTNVQNQLVNASSLKGMNKMVPYFMGKLPEEYVMDEALKPDVSGQVAMSDAERAAMSEQVIFPEQLLPKNTKNMMHAAMIDRSGGDLEAASEMYNVSVSDLQASKAALTEVDPFMSAALQTVDIANYKLKLDYATTTDARQNIMADFFNEISTTATQLRLINESLTSGGELKTVSLAGITDDTMLNIGGENITFGQILKEMQEAHGEKATREAVIKSLESKNTQIVQST